MREYVGLAIPSLPRSKRPSIHLVESSIEEDKKIHSSYPIAFPSFENSTAILTWRLLDVVTYSSTVELGKFDLPLWHVPYGRIV